MLKKTLAILLAVFLCVSAFVVAPLSAVAQEVDVADEAADVDITDEAAEADVAETGITFRYKNGILVDDDDYEVLEVGSHRYKKVTPTYASISNCYWSSSNRNIVYVGSDSGGAFECIAKSVGRCNINCTVESYEKTGQHISGNNIIYDYTTGSRSKTFYFRVVPEGKAVPGVYDPNSGTTLSTPIISGCSSVDEGVKINWGAVAGAEKYRVFYKGSNGWTKLGDTTSTTFTDTVVRSGGTYIYTVRCINSSATKYTSDYKSGFTYTYNMDTPKITGFSSSSAGVKITWGAVPNAKKYSVFYKGRNGWVKMANTTATSYTDSDVRYDKTYTYTVRCIKYDGTRYTSSYNNSGWKHTHFRTLATPRIHSSDVVSNGIKLYWGAVSGAEKYRVFYKGSTGWKKLLDTTATSCVDTDVRYDKTYTYTVRCLSADGSYYTSSYDAAGRRVTYCSPPEILEVDWDNSDDTLFVDISCEHYELMDYYKVWYKTSSGWTYLGSTTEGWILDPRAKLTPGKYYTFTVRGYDSNNNAMSYFDTSGFYEYVWDY